MNQMTDTYIFPKALANRMVLVNQKIQYESQMLATLLLLVGLIFSGVYFFIYFNFAIWYKVVLVINILAGVVIMAISIISTYQQYVSFMAAVEFQKKMSGENILVVPLDLKKVRRIRVISSLALAGTALIIGFVIWYINANIYIKGISIVFIALLVGKAGSLYLNTKKFIQKENKRNGN